MLEMVVSKYADRLRIYSTWMLQQSIQIHPERLGSYWKWMRQTK